MLQGMIDWVSLQETKTAIVLDTDIERYSLFSNSISIFHLSVKPSSFLAFFFFFFPNISDQRLKYFTPAITESIAVVEEMHFTKKICC